MTQPSADAVKRSLELASQPDVDTDYGPVNPLIAAIVDNRASFAAFHELGQSIADGRYTISCHPRSDS